MPERRRDFTFYEFFAGGGMARIGLGPGWRCLFANDVDAGKAAAYADNFSTDEFRLGDVAALTPRDLPERADLVWASFPCQDLSLAGDGRGLDGARSGVFWAFWRLMEGLVAEARAPRLVVIENVVGLLTARGGRDFAAVATAVARAGYSVGAMALDAAPYTAQSRPRLFILGLREAETPPGATLRAEPSAGNDALAHAVADLPEDVRNRWRWWRAPPPPVAEPRLDDILERAPNDVGWDAPEMTARLCAMMSAPHRAKLEAARALSQREGRVVAGTLYRRTRLIEDGRRAQRAEVRFDGVAGCLRTPAGGSSRQRLILVDGEIVRTRLISAREAARLMGLPDDYRLPARYNAAYKLIGDGVAPPVVRALAAALLEPLLAATPPAAAPAGWPAPKRARVA